MALAMVLPSARQRMIHETLGQRRIDNQKFERFSQETIEFVADDA